MSIQSEYNKKLRTCEQIFDIVKDGWYICGGQLAGNPKMLFSNLHKLKGRVKGIEMQASLLLSDYPFLQDPEMVETLRFEGFFFGAYERKAHTYKMAGYTPANLSQCAVRKLSYKKPNIFWGVSAPPDEHGNFCISFSIAYEMEMLEKADIIVIEVNPDAPRTFGDNVVNIKDVDYIIESDLPVDTLVSKDGVAGVDDMIGKNVASLIEDGSTIQLGIGAIPNAVALHFNDKKHLGVHTEMITDSMAELFNAGIIDNSKKTLHKDKMIGTFVYGSKGLYDFVHNNASVYLLRGCVANDPFVIMQNYKMCSINTGLQIDLTGQVCSESIGHKQYSGTGGQAETAYGAQRSQGGKSIIALRSTAKNETISTITPLLTVGSMVSLSRNDTDYVVTEYGVACLRGRNISERVSRLISIAHPKFRDMLSRQADELMIW
ncbi:MAG: 4-hydroxybutyrate--acetyl-CoA CoA transferase [Firmicutes bacterium]|nr:4-hydroxybutyrate--acetyl-CoA CoA transferase [Bacillota bacterium]